MLGPAVAGDCSDHLDGRGFAVPSIVSDVSATLVAPPQWSQGPTQTQQSDGQPFAALLDATTATPAPTTPPANPPPQSQSQAPTQSDNPAPASAAGNAQNSGSSASQPSDNAGAASNSNSLSAPSNPPAAVSTRSGPSAGSDTTVRTAGGQAPVPILQREQRAAAPKHTLARPPTS